MNCPVCEKNGKLNRLWQIVDDRYRCNQHHLLRLRLNVSGDGGNCELILLEPDGSDSTDTWPVECPEENK